MTDKQKEILKILIALSECNIPLETQIYITTRICKCTGEEIGKAIGYALETSVNDLYKKLCVRGARNEIYQSDRHTSW